MNLYLWGAESRDFGSIITGWVAADRKNRPICWSSFAAAAADCGERECFWVLFLLFNINNSLLLSSVVDVCCNEHDKMDNMHTHTGGGHKIMTTCTI